METNKSYFDLLPKDLIEYIIIKYAQDEKALAIYNISPYIKEVCCRDNFRVFRTLMNQRYAYDLNQPDIISTYTNHTARRQKYAQLFETILYKYAYVSEFGESQYKPLDLYNLLYEMNEHSMACVEIPSKWSYADTATINLMNEFGRFPDIKENIPDVLLEMNNLYYLLEYYFPVNTSYKRRDFLNDIKNNIVDSIIIQEYFDNEVHNYNIDLNHNTLDFTNMYPNINNITFEDYLYNLSTLESRFQQFIIDNTEEDVREEIDLNHNVLMRNYYSNLCDLESIHINAYIPGNTVNEVTPSQLLELSLYSKDEIEFLQLIHYNIRIGKLKIFDVLDCKTIVDKLLE